MSVRFNQHIDVSLIDQHSMYDAVPVAQRDEIISNIIYLLHNVAPEDKNPLIKTRIINSRFERFDLARALVEGDTYFEHFLRTLDFNELQNLFTRIVLPVQQKIILKPQTQAAFDFVLKGQPVSTPELMIKQSFDAVGNFFAGTLEKEVERQYHEANFKYPNRNLELNELRKCGNPCEHIFTTYLSLVQNNQHRAKFNKIIRETLLNKDLSSYKVQQRLLYTADRLADVLMQQAVKALNKEERERHKTSAEQIRLILEQAGYRSTRDKSVEKPNMLNKTRNLLQSVREMLAFKKPKKVSKRVETEPIPVQTGNDPEPDAFSKLQELYARFAQIQAQIQAQTQKEAQLNARNNLLVDRKKDLTFAYDATPLSYSNANATDLTPVQERSTPLYKAK